MLKNDDLIYFRSTFSNRLKYFASISADAYLQDDLINSFALLGLHFKFPESLQFYINRSFYINDKLNQFNLEKRLKNLNLNTDIILYDVDNLVSCFALKFEDVFSVVKSYVEKIS